MKNQSRHLLTLSLLLLALLPLAGDAGQDECCNASTSLAIATADPTNGDEAFFKRSNSASSVMLLLDTSGSMEWLPACFSSGQDISDTTSDPAETCAMPDIPQPANPTNTASNAPVVNGTCLPATGASKWCKSGATSVGCTGLAWMEAVKPQVEFADVGMGGSSSNDMYDCPPWGAGPGCATQCKKGDDECLFDPEAFYKDGSWNQYKATRLKYTSGGSSKLADASDATGACVVLNSSGNVVMDPKDTTKPLSLGADCWTCMKDHGFYMYNATYWSGYDTATSKYKSPVATDPRVYFRGTFLNANPPKVVTARRVVKKLLWMDQTSSVGKLDRIRFGLTVFKDDDNASIVSGLVPGAETNASPFVKATYRAARQPILSYINNKSNDLAHTATPLGKSLFQIGQYFAKKDFYSARTGWGSSWQSSAYDPISGTCSVCWSCQKSSVVVITDGQPNEDESAFPLEIVGTPGSPGKTCTPKQIKNGCKPVPPTPASPGFDQAGYAKWCLDAAGNDICGDIDNNPATLPRVASFLHKIPVTKFDTSLDIYTIGFNLPPGDAQNVLVATGKMGGGEAYNPQDTNAVEEAVFKAVESAAVMESTFNAPSVDSLQTSQTATSDAFLTRFLPNDTNLWEGHVFPGAIFDEFANGCDPTKPPDLQPLVACGKNGKKVPADYNGNIDPVTGLSICSDAFLVDSECDAIGEDPNANGFMKLDKTTWLPMVDSPAVFAWDAGEVLSTPGKTGYRTAATSANSLGQQPRAIYTWLPLNGTPQKVEFRPNQVATLKPYLSIDPAWCTNLLTTIAFTPLPADQLTECAKQIIYFVRGYDIFGRGKDGCRAPGHPLNPAACATTPNSGERNRTNDPADLALGEKLTFWKLGDIFHSSPVAVRAPADVFRCDLGYDNQCVTTIHSPVALPKQTPNPFNWKDPNGNPTDAWNRYRYDQAQRKRVVLVGANDGMLHAFDGGSATTGPDKFGNYAYDEGTGEELWAYIPADLLPKLWRMVKAGTTSDHQYFVDGSTMVRDVWVDGSGAAAKVDGVKQPDEFHTVAILSERSGGTQYTALDVTNPASPSGLRVLWSFPKPCSEEAKYMGQSWTDFAPRPPPIGPVRLAVDPAATGQDPNVQRGFEERWVAMLNGGYDPTLARGRAVFMVDAWTGSTLWKVTDDDIKDQLGFDKGTSMFPVPAAVALVDIGDTSKANRDLDGFFDTATWGDLGGNLWVARFHEPGVLKSGKVSNWFVGRTFEEQRLSSGQNIKGRQPFFYMTSNAYEGTSRTLRTFLGSGNREQMTAKGGKCNANNLLGCCQAGCSVTSSVLEDFGSCNSTMGFACAADGTMSRAATSTTSACGATATCAASAKFSETITASVTCGSTTTPVTGAITCAADGTCASTLSSPALTSVGEGSIGTSLPAPANARFYSIWSYGRNAAKVFATSKEAKTFDDNRFTDSSSFSGTCAGPSGGTCRLVDVTGVKVGFDPANPTGPVTISGSPATSEDAGWFMDYVPDEKTGAGATLVLGCATWNSLQPTNDTGGTDMCSGNASLPVTLGYLSDFVTGAPSYACGYADDASKSILRYTKRTTTAPPATSTVRVAINAKGQVEYSTLRLDPGGAPGVKVIGTRNEVSEPVYWLEVPRDLHACRHVSAANCK